MNRVFLTIAVLLTVRATLAYEEEVKADASNQATERVEEVCKKAKDVMDQFEQVNGSNLRTQLEAKFQEKRKEQALKSANETLNSLLGKAFGKIQEAKGQNQEISDETIYEACWTFMRYMDIIENEEMKFPSWLSDAFKEENNRLCPAIMIVLKSTEKRLVESPRVVTIVSKKD